MSSGTGPSDDVDTDRDDGTGSVGTTDDGAETADDPVALGPPENLVAIGAHEMVGLRWSRVLDATGYNLYWTDQPGAEPDQRIEGVEPGFLHTSLTDGVEIRYAVTAVGPQGEGPASVPTSATPGGDFVLERLGTGELFDLSTGMMVELPVERQVHAVVVAEGYQAGDSSVFAADVDGWQAEVFGVEPYSAFAQAFVVWSLAAVSNEHPAPGVSDTAFAVPITSDNKGIGDVGSATAQRVWAALEAFAFAPSQFFDPGGRTDRLARNVVVAMLVYEPADGESGYSGKARYMTRPGGSERVGVAIAHNRVHEFTHAFSLARDEYLEDDNGNNGVSAQEGQLSANVTNLAETPDCSALPWSHLLYGGEFNDSADQLVGAFGHAGNGYHPEFKCLMNGTHDNAAYYGGDGYLRVEQMCNWCRELATFRLYERVLHLPDQSTALAEWAEAYRAPFYEEFGLRVPNVVPQRNSSGEGYFEACVP